MSLILWVRSVKRSKLRGRKITRLSKGHLSIKYSEVSLLSPGVLKAHLFEFPRSNLELQNIIGKFLSLCQCSYRFCSFGVFMLHLCLYIQVKDVLERCIRVKRMELFLMLQIWIQWLLRQQQLVSEVASLWGANCICTNSMRHHYYPSNNSILLILANSSLKCLPTILIVTRVCTYRMGHKHPWLIYALLACEGSCSWG